MSFQAMAWAVRQRLPTREKFVLLMLANYASNDQGDCYPSLNRLADDTGMVRNTIIDAIKALESMGALAVIRRQQDGVNLPNVYRLNLAWGGGAADALPVQMPGGGSAPDAPESIKEPITKKKERARERVTWDDNAGLDVPASIMATLEAAYGARCNVQAEIVKASAWCRCNPQRRPRKDFGRFVNGWLSRAGERVVVSGTAPPRNRHDRNAQFLDGLFSQEDRRVVDVVDLA